MVNLGRSGGCVTCRRRRVKCDEAKPHCRACQRLKLCCGGYVRPKYARLKFKDESHKFCTDADQGVDLHSHSISKAATSPSRLSVCKVQERQAARRLTLRCVSVPDTAVSFYLSHYASMGRDMESTRGFFEMLIPAYLAQGQDSALSLAVSVLSSEILSLWQHDASSFRTPRQSYSQAIARLQDSIQDPEECGRPATVLAVLTLQTYENACAIYNLRPASRTHHSGAASLLSVIDASGVDGTVRAYLRKFMVHTEVSTAMRQTRPLRSVAYSWIASKQAITVPDNPSAALDAISASFAELQASYTDITTKPISTMLVNSILQWRIKAQRVDAELLAWAEKVPYHWRPQKLLSGRDIDVSIPTYQSVCEVYPSCQIASIWNLWRFQRLLVAKMTLDSLTTFSNAKHFDFITLELETDADLLRCVQILQEAVDSMCYSIPYYLGNRTSRSALTDFTDPKVLLPSDFVLTDEVRLSSDNLGAGFSRQDLRRHVIAQGPWRAMHPLSRLVTLLSEDNGDAMAKLLKPLQKEWIRDQFLRVATLLHLPSASENSMKASEAASLAATARAEYLATQIRQGAVLMSGP